MRVHFSLFAFESDGEEIGNDSRLGHRGKSISESGVHDSEIMDDARAEEEAANQRFSVQSKCRGRFAAFFFRGAMSQSHAVRLRD